MDEQQKKIYKGIQRTAETIEDRFNSHKIRDDYGLCNRCKYFKVVERELDTVIDCLQIEWDRLTKFQISKLNKVLDCSQFMPVGSLDINAMWNMAKLIEVEDKQIGFNLSKEVKITDTTESDECYE